MCLDNLFIISPYYFDRVWSFRRSFFPGCPGGLRDSGGILLSPVGATIYILNSTHNVNDGDNEGLMDELIHNTVSFLGLFLGLFLALHTHHKTGHSRHIFTWSI